MAGVKHLSIETCFAYLAGQLPEVERVALELHFAACPKCAKQVREAAEFDIHLHSLAAPATFSVPGPDPQIILEEGLRRASLIPGAIGQRIKKWLDQLPGPRKLAVAAVRVLVGPEDSEFVLTEAEREIGKTSDFGAFLEVQPAFAFRRLSPQESTETVPAAADERVSRTPVYEVHAIKERMAKIITKSGSIEARVAKWPENEPLPLLLISRVPPGDELPLVQEFEAEPGARFLRARKQNLPEGEYELAILPA